MAIEFQCPYCTAAIRVPDSAAGKKGTCPKCGTKLLVPQIEIPPQTDTGVDAEEQTPPPRPAPPPFAPSEFPTPGVPTSGPAVPAGGDQAGAFDFDPSGPAASEPDDKESSDEPFIPEFSPAAQPSLAAKLRRRQRARWTGLLMPLLFGGLLLAAGVWYYWTTRPVLEGELPAVALAEAKLPPRLVRTEIADVSPSTAEFVQSGLAESPERLRSNLMEMEFRGVPRRGIEVSLIEGTDTRFYRVDIRADRHLNDYMRQHADELDKAHQAELRRYVTRFYTDWEQAEQADRPIDDLLGFRDGLGLNALTGSLGFHLAAEHAGKKYRCVYEDDQGRVYFLLPRNVRTFRLRGRELPDGRTPFPGDYTVNVVETEAPPEKDARLQEADVTDEDEETPDPEVNEPGEPGGVSPRRVDG
jgi:hypothetical protein